jgi:flagellar basal body-associated protein FliL
MKAEEDRAEEMPVPPAEGKKRPVKRVGALLLLFALALSAFVWSRISSFETQGTQAVPVAGQIAVQGTPVVALDPFLIPLGEKSKYTFVSLAFALELPHGQSAKEVREKMNELRGCLYDRLKEDFQKAEGIPLVQAVKDSINRVVRTTLPGLQIREIYFSQFLAL